MADWRVLAVQIDDVQQVSGQYNLRPPVMSLASADHAKVVVGTALAMLLSCAAACSPLQLQAELPQLARLMGELNPWLMCVSSHSRPVINVAW